jgi:hypothetical protein
MGRQARRFAALVAQALIATIQPSRGNLSHSRRADRHSPPGGELTLDPARRAGRQGDRTGHVPRRTRAVAREDAWHRQHLPQRFWGFVYPPQDTKVVSREPARSPGGTGDRRAVPRQLGGSQAGVLVDCGHLVGGRVESRDQCAGERERQPRFADVRPPTRGRQNCGATSLRSGNRPARRRYGPRTSRPHEPLELPH